MDSKNFKKRPQFDSIDGMIPRKNSQLPKSTTHQYYRGSGTTSDGPRHPNIPQASRRRPHHMDDGESKDQISEKSPLVGDFSAKRDNIFESPMHKTLHTPEIEKSGKHPKEKKQPGKLRRWWKNRSRRFKFGAVTFVILLIAGGILGVRLYSFLNSVFGRGVGNSSSAALGGKVRPDQLNTEGDGRLNVLLLGRGGSENEAPDLTDTLLIASIDLENQSTSLLSIPRDMWVNVDGESMKINTAFSTGKAQAIYRGKSDQEAEDEGIKTTIEAVRNVAGVPIHKYVLTDYKAFRDVVNALGGVDINVKSAIYDGFTGWSFKAGQQTMNGDKALQYARTRHGTARGDFDRNEHQRQLLVAMRSKATSTGIVANPVRLNSLANAIQKNIRTDLSLDEAKIVFDKTKAMADSSIVSLDLAKPDEPLITTGSAGGLSVVHPVAGVSDFTKIRAYARINMIDPFLKKESPTVAIYNGSGKAGTATLIGDVLAGYGYKVPTKETSKETQSKTLVVKMTKTDKPFTDRFLSVRFGVAISSSLPENVVPDSLSTDSSSTENSNSSQPDYIIILGADYTQQNGPTW